MKLHEIIIRPLVLTEKGNALREQNNQYSFEVDRRANKIQIRQAVEALFKVDVGEVRTLVVRGRMRRMGRGQSKNQNWKKAIVALKPGESIELFDA